MARILTLQHGSATFLVNPVKVERTKLYGTTGMRATTPEGKFCHIAGINGDGITVVEPGYTKTGIMTDDGLWADRSELKAVMPDGTDAPLVESSFNSEISLDTKVSENDLLAINVSSVYQLSGADTLQLASQIGDDIYTFRFSYCGGYEPCTAFLMVANGVLYIITGTNAPLEFIGIDQNAVLDNDSDEDILDDELDFSMM